MKLNEEGKNELQNRILELLMKVPEGKRIRIEKELLEELLFQTVIYDKKNKKSFKLPIWTGTFLEKIDLSEVSFEDVSWDILAGVSEEDKAMRLFDDDIKETYHIENAWRPDIIYANTNANIDFTKSWEYKTFQEIKLCDCDFSNTDLSSNDMSHFTYAYNCNFSNTGLKLPDLNQGATFKIYNSTLDGLDLSHYTVDILSLLDDTGCFNDNCSFSGTSLHIVNLSKSTLLNASPENSQLYLTVLKSMFVDGYFDGCYINGLYIRPLEEKRRTAAQLKIAYEKFKSLLIDSTLDDIKHQITTLERKK